MTLTNEERIGFIDKKIININNMFIFLSIWWILPWLNLLSIPLWIILLIFSLIIRKIKSRIFSTLFLFFNISLLWMFVYLWRDILVVIIWIFFVIWSIINLKNIFDYIKIKK